MPASPDKNAQDTHNSFEQVHARLLRYYPDLVTQLGGDPRTLLRAVKIDSNASSTDGQEASYRQLVNLLELASAKLGCPDFGMRLAKKQNGVDSYGPLGLVMQSSVTFGEAIEYVTTHNFAHSLAARIWIDRSFRKEEVLVHHDILLEGLPNKVQAMEQIMLLGHLGALQITGGLAHARAVHFRHQPVSSRHTYQRYFGCAVQFGCDEDGVVFSTQDLARPIIDPNRYAFERRVAFIERHYPKRRPPIHAEVRGVILSLLPSGEATYEHVALALNLHPRTLHRRLLAESTSFQKVKDEVRRDLMQYYLQETDIELARISEKLGFSEQAVMSRRCRCWFDASPSQLRQRGVRS